MAVTATSAAEDSGSSSYIYSLDFTPGRRRHNSVDGTKAPPGRVSRPKSASNILDTHEDFQRRLYDPLLAPHLQHKPKQENGVTDLVDFLRNQSPPPDNFMSIPDDGTDERGRSWVKWKKIARRSRSAPRPPRPIRLPDTAVSGMTIGGHRHIAITIPSEAFPLGDIPRSQYPVFSQGDTRRHTGPSRGSVRTVVNDKGVVTVLRTVNERHEGQSLLDRANEADAHHGPYSSTPSRGAYTASTGYSSVPPSRGSGSATLNDDRLGREAPRMSRASPWAYPSRASSKVKVSMHQPISIDGMIAQDGNAARVATDSKNDNDGVKSAYAIKPLPPIVDKGKGRMDEEEETGISKETGAILLKENPLGPSRKDKRPTTPLAANRRDKVRDKKLRDMEALRTMKQQEQPSGHDAAATALPRKSSKRKSQDLREVQKESVPTLSPIRVVVDVEPSPTLSETSMREDLRPSQLEITRPVQNRNSAPGALSPPVLPANKLSDAVFPRLLPISPQRPQNPLDRTSLSRRREWKATREQERKTKEARAAVRARAMQLAAGLGDEPADQAQALDREILRLYEAYREHRFRDMERRVQRLERNGDIWLRALVPVLESLNPGAVPRSGSGLMHGREEAEQRAWASDDEQATRTFNREMYKHRPGPIRRASCSHRTLPEDLADGDAGSLCGSASGSDDLNGLDAIEPLMRELAGAAALRQMRSGKLLYAH